MAPKEALQAIAGKFLEDAADEPKVAVFANGSCLVAGWIPADELAELREIELASDRDFEMAASVLDSWAGRRGCRGR
ncbi:hypothetical protein [uncultured Jannaschia sp.]|uniref:hypothetical protein n=1 Tax=uncultured Jannaschia sp. TaxID=293347 RepID=UPI00262D0200|nr:hypothetical protein [uncultured Jannaschia sp.]